MPNNSVHSPATSRLLAVGATVLFVAALYLAKAVLIPVTLAILLAFLLNPLVRRVKSWGLAHIPSVAVVGGAALIMLLILAGFFALQLADVVDHLPQYAHGAQEKLRVVIDPLRELAGRASASMHEIATAPSESTAPSTLPHLASAPAVAAHTSQDLALLTSALSALGVPIGVLGIAVVLAGAMLIQGSDLRDRITRLIGDSRVSITTSALDDTAERVSRYLLRQTLLNGTQGIVVSVVLVMIGLPGAVLWGVMWAILRFLPYVGPWIGAALPIVTALGHFDSLTQPLLVMALFVVIEIACNTIFEPWLYGAGTGLSPLAVLVAAVFWAWLWGWVGLLLATPLTVCLAVLGQYVPQLEFLHVLLGDEPVLRPSVRLYQRLITNQRDEAKEIIAAEIAAKSSAAAFESVVIPALAQAERDHRRGQLDDAKVAGMHALVDELLREMQSDQAEAPATAAGSALCLPARDEADALCGRMLQIVCAERGLSLEVIESGYLANEKAEFVAERSAKVVVVSALSVLRESYLRHTIRRIAHRSPDTNVIAGLWTQSPSDDIALDRLNDQTSAVVVTSLSEAADAVRLALMGRHETVRALLSGDSRRPRTVASPAPESRSSPLNARAAS